MFVGLVTDNQLLLGTFPIDLICSSFSCFQFVMFYMVDEEADLEHAGQPNR